MKLSKYAMVVKKDAACNVIRVESDGMWLGTSSAIYRASGLPEIRGREQMRTILSFTDKQMDKVFLREFDFEDMHDVIGCDLCDFLPGEQKTTPVKMVASIKGKRLTALRAEDGELIFYDSAYMLPLADELKDAEYMELTIRKTKGHQYIAVKNGFNVLAIIMPCRVINDKFLADLQEFQALCFEQRERDKSRQTTGTRPEALDIESEQEMMGGTQNDD